MQHKSIFVFDIETVPDTSIVPNLLGKDMSNASNEELRKALEQYHLDATDGKNGFPRQPFHKIVAISFLEAEIQREDGKEYYLLRDIRSGGDEFADETELVQGFFHYLGKLKPRLVSYNGRTFDLPVLKYRAMHHNVQAGWLYHEGDKWNSYTSRYSLDWHCDLLEAMSDFGASARVKLDEVCSILGFPGKFGVDGSKVAEMYDQGQNRQIRDYCETDVLNTYLVYLRYMYHRNDITIHGYNRAIDDVLAYIESKKDSKKHLAEFLSAWKDASGGKFNI